MFKLILEALPLEFFDLLVVGIPVGLQGLLVVCEVIQGDILGLPALQNRAVYSIRFFVVAL